jgi:hypothetical protein
MGARVVFLPPEAEGAPAPTDGSVPPARALLIPAEALCRRDGQEGVFVLEGDVVHFRAVAAGEQRGGQVVIQEGLARGEQLVSPPPPTLRDGDRVLPEEAAQ